jgi:hypothetical protein
MSTLLIGVGLVGSQIARELVSAGEDFVAMDVDPKLDAISQIVDPHRLKIVRGGHIEPTRPILGDQEGRGVEDSAYSS